MDGAPLAEFKDGYCRLLGGYGGGSAGEGGEAYQGSNEFHDDYYLT